jgi:hypothetical protein
MSVNALNGTNGFQDPTGFGLTDPAKTGGYEKSIDQKGEKPATLSSQLARVMLPASLVDIRQIGASLTPPNYGTPAMSAGNAQTGSGQADTASASGDGGGIKITSGGKKELDEKALRKFAETDPQKAYDVAVKNGWLELAGDIKKIKDKQEAKEQTAGAASDRPSATRSSTMVIATDPTEQP